MKLFFLATLALLGAAAAGETIVTADETIVAAEVTTVTTDETIVTADATVEIKTTTVSGSVTGVVEEVITGTSTSVRGFNKTPASVETGPTGSIINTDQECLFTSGTANSLKIGALRKDHLAYDYETQQLSIEGLAVKVKTPAICDKTSLDLKVGFYEVTNCKGKCFPNIACSNRKLTKKAGFEFTKFVNTWITTTTQKLSALIDLKTVKKGACACKKQINVNFCLRVEIQLHRFTLFVDEAKFKILVNIHKEGDAEVTSEITHKFITIAPPPQVEYRATILATLVSKPQIFFCERSPCGKHWVKKLACDHEVEQPKGFALCMVGDTFGSTITNIHDVSLQVAKECQLCLESANGGDRCAWDARDRFHDRLLANQVKLVKPIFGGLLGTTGVNTQFLRSLLIGPTTVHTDPSSRDPKLVRQGFVLRVRLSEHFFSGCKVTATLDATVKSSADAVYSGEVSSDLAITVQTVQMCSFTYDGYWTRPQWRLYYEATEVVYDVIKEFDVITQFV